MPLPRPSAKKMSFSLAILLAVFVFSGKPSSSNLLTTGSPQTRGQEYVSGEVIIKMKPGVQLRMGKTAAGAVTSGIASLDKVMTRFQGAELKPIFPDHARPTSSGGVDLTQFYRFHYRDGSDPKSVAKILHSTGATEYAEPRYIRYVNFVPN